LTVLTTVTSASSNSALPDDGDYIETCWSSLNVNFNTLFKNLCIIWCKNFNNQNNDYNILPQQSILRLI